MYDKYRIVSFLKEVGLSDIQIEIYYYFLSYKSGTIDEIKKEINYSYTQIYNNLSTLENKGLISSSESKPKVFFRENPKMILTKLLVERFKQYNEKIQKVEGEIKRNESTTGYCLKELTFYYYNDINLGIQKLCDLIENAKEEIVLTSLPPFLLKKLEFSLRNAFMRKIDITIYFSNKDFDLILNFFEEVKDIFKRIKITVVQTEEETCRNIIFNDIIVQNGFILIDKGYFNTIGFKDNKTFFISGFYSRINLQELKRFLNAIPIEEKVEIQYPIYQDIIDIVQQNNPIKTQDLSRLSKVSGGKLKEIVDFLIKEEIIKESIQASKVGRPGKYYSLTR
ncbi:MAG: TrmB family transcriptional regulator [Promethearchaeota archaeon]